MNLAEKVEQAAQFRKSNEHEKALKILTDCHRQSPHDAEINYRLACLHDFLGKESQAVEYYETALANGLTENRANAFLCLGSTYRCLGEYDKSFATFQKGIEEFPAERSLQVFYAVTLYNLGRAKDGMALLLHQLLDTTSNTDIKSYERPLRFYADRLDEVWK